MTWYLHISALDVILVFINCSFIFFASAMIWDGFEGENLSIESRIARWVLGGIFLVVPFCFDLGYFHIVQLY